MDEYTRAIIEVIKAIPAGKVCTYGHVARLAGRPGGARQVARVLHSSSRTHNLPWQRVVNVRGRISLPKLGGYEEQKARLQAEGITFHSADRIDLHRFLWNGERSCQRSRKNNPDGKTR